MRRDHLSLIFHTHRHTTRVGFFRAIQQPPPTSQKNACNNRSRAQAPPGSTQAAVLKKEHSRNQPFIQRDEDASTRTNKHKNVGFQRQHVFLDSPNAALSESTGRKENRRKAQRLLPISTSTPPLDPQTRSHKQRVQSIQSQKWAGEPKQESEGRGE